MGGMKKQLVWMIVMVAVVMGVVVGAKISCSTVVSRLGPCLPYVTDKGPIGKCCDGVKSLHEAAKSTPDRQAVCECLKNMANSYSGINFDKAAKLPQQCGVDLPYVISPDIDCSKVK